MKFKFRDMILTWPIVGWLGVDWPEQSVTCAMAGLRPTEQANSQQANGPGQGHYTDEWANDLPR